MTRKIAAGDIVPLDTWARVRGERRQQLVALKKTRRLHVGPHATIHFECFETMRHQVQEMLYIEKGGDEQLAGELEAYNPLVPDGTELVATVMFEVEDEARRHRLLASLGGVEQTMALIVAGETVRGAPEADVERTSPQGKASSVQFLHFRFTPAQIARFRLPGTQVVFAIDHPAYQHQAVLPETMRAVLAGDFG